MDRSDEIRALGDLAGDALAETVRVVEDVHRAVSDRVDAALPASAKPVSAIVRASTSVTYATVRAAHRWIPRGTAAVTAARTPADSPSMLATPAGARAMAAVNGIWGAAVTDRVALTTPLALFHLDEPLSLEGPVLALPDARPHLVLFVHGLAETEADWNRQPRGGGERRMPYAERLETDADVTSLAIRYSSGHAVGRNGTEISELLDTIAAMWPVPLDSVSLIGHSMGGLVARSAAHHGDDAGHAWVSKLRLVVTLGTPHLGAPLEQAVHMTERALAAFPESAPLGRILGARSHGVRDMRHGRILIGDSDLDPPAVAGVVHCAIGSTLTQDHDHPIGVLIGDGLVRLPSAAGRSRTRHLKFEVDTRVGGLSHLGLLNEPEIYTLIRGWIEEFGLA